MDTRSAGRPGSVEVVPDVADTTEHMPTFRPRPRASKAPQPLTNPAGLSAAGIMAGGQMAVVGGPRTEAIVLERSVERSTGARNRYLNAVAVPTLVLAAVAPVVIGEPVWIAILAVIGAGLLIGMATVPIRVALLTITLVPVTSGFARGSLIPGLRISEVLIVLAVAIVVGLPMPQIKRWSFLDYAVLAFAGASVALPLFDVIVITDRSPTLVDLQVILGPAQFVLIYIVTSQAMHSGKNQVKAQRALLLASVPVSALAIAEQIGPPAIHDFLVSLTGSGAFTTNGFTAQLRAASVFPMWLALAGYLLVVLLLGISLLLAEATDVLPTWALGAVVGLGTLALFATLTFTVIGALVLGALYLGWRHGKLVKVSGLVVSLGLIAFVAFNAQIMARIDQQTVSAATQREAPNWLPETIGYRLVIWEDQYVPLLKQYSATGYGPGLPPEVTWAHTESGYITLLLRGGIPLMALTAIVVVAVWRRSRQEVQAATTASRVALAETAGVLALVQIPINLTFPYFTNSGMPQAMWVVWGLLAATQSPVRGKRIRLRGMARERQG